MGRGFLNGDLVNFVSFLLAILQLTPAASSTLRHSVGRVLT